MKTKVIEFFQNLPEEKHEQFNQAFELYKKSEFKNPAAERVINATGYTPSGLDNLLYDLQKMHGITDVEKVKIADGSKQMADSSEQVADGSEEIANGSEQVEELSEQVAELESENEDLKDENEGLTAENEELKAEVETLKLAPKLDAKQIRVEFPFLNEKDCPDELKILVADKITAWNKYLEIQEHIQKAEAGEVVENADTLAILAKEAIEAFDENQKIYDELNCYQTTGKVLGVHPIFKKLQLSREVETMTADELIKYKASSAKYFSVNKTALAKAKKAKDEVKAQEIETRVAERHDKLFLVNKKLGV